MRGACRPHRICMSSDHMAMKAALKCIFFNNAWLVVLVLPRGSERRYELLLSQKHVVVNAWTTAGVSRQLRSA